MSLSSSAGPANQEQSQYPLDFLVGPLTQPGFLGSNGPVEAVPKPALELHEQMAGYIASGHAAPDYVSAYKTGRHRGLPIRFEITITHSDLPLLLQNPASPAKIEGTVFAPLLHPRPLHIKEGAFVLLEPHREHVEEGHMQYQMQLVSPDDPTQQFFLEGHKVLKVSSVLASWNATTTLYVTVYRGEHPEPAHVEGLGMMHIGPSGVLKLLAHADVKHVRSPEKQRYLAQFVATFARSLLPFYGGALNDLARFRNPPSDAVESPDIKADLTLLCDPAGTWSESSFRLDACSRLTRYRGGAKGPVLLAPGFAMSATSFLHRSNTHPSLVDVFVDAGYDVWLFDYRASIDLPSAETQFTVDDIAQLDWPRAVDKVLQVSGAKSVQAFGHCVGSVSLLMALLNDQSDMASKVRAAVCSQFSLTPMTSRFKILEARLRTGNLLEALNARLLHPDTHRSARDIALDVALGAIPVPPGEQCRLPVCRWINAIFGMTHRHAQLDDETHDQLPSMLGVANVRALEHLGLMMKKSEAVDAHGAARYMRAPRRIHGLPIHFLAGDHNYIFHPEGTEKTLQWLRVNNGREDYTVDWLHDYAHLDCLIGRDAAQDVFPSVLGHFEKFQHPVGAQ